MKKSEKTKSIILDSAIKILRTTGNLTFMDISEDCGVNVASINYHFGSKEELLKLVINRLIGELKSIINTHIDNNNLKNADINVIAEHLLKAIYNFSSLNTRFLRYTFNNSNISISNYFTSEFLSIFFRENDFTKDILQKIKMLSEDENNEHAMTKYIILVSSFAFPLCFDLNILGATYETPISLSNETIKELYIKTLLLVLSKKTD